MYRSHILCASRGLQLLLYSSYYQPVRLLCGNSSGPTNSTLHLTDARKYVPGCNGGKGGFRMSGGHGDGGGGPSIGRMSGAHGCRQLRAMAVMSTRA